MKFKALLLIGVVVLFCFPSLSIGQNSDCSTAINLCSKSTVSISKLEGSGTCNNEVTDLPCLPEGVFETNSVWLKWEISKSGDLGFIITPDNIEDDIDFVLYRLPNDNDICENKEVVRCMTSGENMESAYSDWNKCLGITGLRKSDSDSKEERGCKTDDNNFLSNVDMTVGETYLLVVNNYKSTSGFNISFSGSTEFNLNPLIISGMKEDASLNYFIGDSILLVDYFVEEIADEQSRIWDFGKDAYSSSIEGKGPHSVWYSSSGSKQVIQKVTTANGCLLTGEYQLEIKDEQIIEKSNQEISIYPNPANDAITVSLSLTEKSINSFTIKDEIGRVVQNYNADNFTTKDPIKIDIKTFASGVYFICIELESEIIKKRFVKI